MKQRMILLFAFASVILAGTYIWSQQPKIWWNRQHAGFALFRGGYRSWVIQFCDGETFINGKFQPVVVDELKGVRPGYYRWPRFRHSDLRELNLE